MPRLFGLPSAPVPGPAALPMIGAPLRFFQFLDDRPVRGDLLDLIDLPPHGA